MRTYTIAEARAALQVDAKTLRAWIEKAGITPERGIDSREKRLTEAHLSRLARDHQRLLNLSALDASSDRPEYKILRDRLTDVEQHASELDNELQQVRAQLQALALQVEALLLPLAQKARSRSRATTSPSASDLEQELPGGLVALQSFFKLHTMPESTVRRAVAAGRLPTIEGDWKVGHARVKQALDAGGRSAFYRMYAHHPSFTHCEQCPHDTGDKPALQANLNELL